MLSEQFETSDAARIALEAAGVGVAILDRNLCYAYKNASFDELVRIERGTGRRFSDAALPVPRDIERAIERIAAGSDTQARFEKSFEGRRYRVGLHALRDRSETEGVVVTLEDVTSTLEMSDPVTEQLERFQLLVENSIDLIALFDQDGIFAYASPASEQLLGYAPSELIGRPATFPVDAGDHDHTHRAFRALRTGERVWLSELRLRHRNGDLVVAECAARAVCEAAGDLQLAVVCVHDITKRRRAEDELRESEQLLRAMLDADSAPLTMSRNGELLEVNRAWLETLGYERSEVVGRCALDFLAPEDVPLVKEHYRRGLESPYTFRGLRKDGSHKMFRARARNIVYRGERARLTSAVDITALKRSEERYRDLVDGIDAVVWEADAETFRLSFVSPHAAVLCGFPTEDWLVPGFWERQLHPDDREHTIRERRRAVGEGRDHTLEYRLFARDGHVVWVHDRVRIVESSDGTRQLRGVLVDTSQRKAEQAERQRLEGELRQAQKMEAIGRLAGGVAHDFGNLLAAISVYSEVAAEATGEPATRADLEKIRQAAQRGRAMTGALLAFSRREEISEELLDVGDVVRGVHDLLQRLVGEHLELKLRLTREPLPVRGERTRIEQVLMNLVANARDAMRAGGEIGIETASVRLDADGKPSDKGRAHALLSVSDSGVGMDADARARAYEPFFTTKPFGEGTGLGLSTVYGIVAQASGRVDIHSEPGRGTRINVYLPRAEMSAAPAPEATEAEAPAGGGDERILFVEDDADVRDAAARALAARGYRVTTATDAAAALDHDLSQVDIVVTDALMPGKTGSKLAEEIRERRSDLPVLVVSGDPSQAVNGDRRRFLWKPFTVDDLTRHVRELLDGR